MPFYEALITEAIRNLEDRGPLDDAQGMRLAVAEAGSRESQLITRARVLAQRLELPTRLQRARALAPLVLLVLALIIALLGFALAGQVVDASDRRINVMAALAALLGVHALMLLLWLMTLCLPRSLAGASNALGQFWLQITAKLTLGRGAEAAALPRALLGLLDRAKLLPWVLGLASHVIWALSFAVVLGALIFALAFRSYTLAWETTILSPDSFVAAVRLLGIAPGWLGFPTPDSNTVLAPVANASGQRLWALWLIGCVAVYGLLPRLLCAAWCALLWRARHAQLSPDFGLPYYRKLFARLDAMAPAIVVDADTGRQPAAVASSMRRHSIGETAAALAVVGFELPAETPWPPPSLAASDAILMRVDGSAKERAHLLDALTQARPHVLVLALSAASTPDRGTARLVRDVQTTCDECRVWLIVSGAPDDSLVARWRDWLAASGLAVTSFTDGLLAFKVD